MLMTSTIIDAGNSGPHDGGAPWPWPCAVRWPASVAGCRSTAEVRAALRLGSAHHGTGPGTWRGSDRWQDAQDGCCRCGTSRASSTGSACSADGSGTARRRSPGHATRCAQAPGTGGHAGYGLQQDPTSAEGARRWGTSESRRLAAHPSDSPDALVGYGLRLAASLLSLPSRSVP